MDSYLRRHSHIFSRVAYGIFSIGATHFSQDGNHLTIEFRSADEAEFVFNEIKRLVEQTSADNTNSKARSE